MGMKQRRCPQCGKKRPYNEGQSTHDSARRGHRWTEVDGILICYHCVLGLDYFPPKGREAEKKTR